MKSLITMAIGATLMLTSCVSSAQNGNMMNGGGIWGGGWMGGYGGYWGPILLIGLVGIVVWVVVKKRK